MNKEHGGRKAQLLRWLGKTDVEWGHDPGQLDLATLVSTAEWMGKLYGQKGWFDLTVKGWEHLPPAPGLFVSNHSGGTTIPDVWGLLYAWVTRHGTSRIVHPLAHDMIFAHPKLGELAAKVGVLRANPRNGRRGWRSGGGTSLSAPAATRTPGVPGKIAIKYGFPAVEATQSWRF